MDSRSHHHDNDSPRFDVRPGGGSMRLRAELHVRHAVAILVVHGDIEAYTRERWCYLLDSALRIAEDYGRLVVDVGDTRFIGCRPVLDLVRSAQQGAARGVEVMAIDSEPSVLDRIIAITGLTEWLPVFTDPAQLATGTSPRPTACAPTRPRSSTARV